VRYDFVLVPLTAPPWRYHAEYRELRNHQRA
jgi:hypothetical protein